MEIWKDVEGFIGLYKISSKGRLKSLGNGKSTNMSNGQERIIKPSRKNNGYLEIKMFKDGQRHYKHLHRLVAEHFIMNDQNKPQVNHKDGDKTNNKSSNLEWVTPSENQIHAIKLGLTNHKSGSDNALSKPIAQYSLDGQLIRTWESINQVKRELGYNSVGIIGCCKKKRKHKTAYKFKWAYV